MALEPIIITKPKLAPKDVGNPKGVTLLPEGQNRYLVGTIYGTATACKVRKVVKPNGDTEVFEPIVGNFEGIPAEPMFRTEKDGAGVETKVQIAAIQSGVLYLPTGIHERLAEPLKKEDAQPIDFAIEIYTVKAANPAGYSYELVPLLKPSASDPLQAIRLQVANKSKGVKAILALMAPAEKTLEKAK